MEKDHLSNSTVGHDVAGMDETIQHLCSLLNKVTLVWILILSVI